MAVRKYSIFDGARKSTYLDVVLGGRAIEATLSLQSVNTEYCYGTVGVPPVGVVAFEVLHYGESLSPETEAMFGIVFGDTTNAPGRGGDNTFGVDIYTGSVEYDDNVIGMIGTGGSNAVFAMVVDFDRRTLAFYRDKQFAFAQNFPSSLGLYVDAGELCYILCSLGDGPAGKSRLWINAGQQQFETPQLSGLGWFETVEAPFNIRVSERDYLTPPTDAEPNTRYRGVITGAGALSTSMLSFWPWGRSSTGASALRLTLANGDGAYDASIGGDFRDEPAELSILQADGSRQFLASYVFDKAEATADNEIQLIFRDSMAELEKPGQDKFFLPNAEGNVANRAYPSTIGAAFSVPLVPYDLLNRLYAVDSLGTARVGKVRDQGDALELGVSPPDYEIVDGGRAVALRFDPEGAVTADIGVTSTDLSSLNGSPPFETLLGGGSPFDAADWTAGSFSDTGVASIVAGEANFELSGANGYQWLEYTGPGTPFISGRGYVIRFTVLRLPGGEDRGTTFYLSRSSSPFNSIFTVRGQPESLYGDPQRPWERTYEFYYTATSGHPLFLLFTPTGLTGGTPCRIGSLTVTEIPVIDPSEEDSEVDEEITPVSLHGAMKQLIEDRWGLPPSFWNEADALQIDAITGYAGVGWHAQEQYVRRQAVEDILTGYTAASFIDESNRLRLVRLYAPELVTDSQVVGEITFRSDMLGDLTPSYDEAPGLTTRLGVRKNYRTLDESDLVTDFLEVPLSLRRRLALDYRSVVTSGVQLAPGYTHAQLASAIGTALARIQDGQNEIDYVCGIYARGRAFYTTRSPFVVGELLLGQTYRVHYPRYGMSAGVKLMLVGLTINPISREVESLVLWGLSPSELLKEQS